MRIVALGILLVSGCAPMVARDIHTKALFPGDQNCQAVSFETYKKEWFGNDVDAVSHVIACREPVMEQARLISPAPETEQKDPTSQQSSAVLTERDSGKYNYNWKTVGGVSYGSGSTGKEVARGLAMSVPYMFGNIYHAPLYENKSKRTSSTDIRLGNNEGVTSTSGAKSDGSIAESSSASRTETINNNRADGGSSSSNSRSDGGNPIAVVSGSGNSTNNNSLNQTQGQEQGQGLTNTLENVGNSHVEDVGNPTLENIGNPQNGNSIDVEQDIHNSNSNRNNNTNTNTNRNPMDVDIDINNSDRFTPGRGCT